MARWDRPEAVGSDQSGMLGRLQKAAEQRSPPNDALDSLTGEWDLAEVKRAAAGTKPARRVRPAQRRTVYLDAQAEADLAFLLGRLSPGERSSRSDVLRRALHATRLAVEGS